MPPRKKPSKRQNDTLVLICESIDQDGRPPTLRELMERLGLSSLNAVNDHLKALERKGWIVRGDGTSRGMRPHFYPDGRPFPSRGDLRDEVGVIELEIERRILDVTARSWEGEPSSQAYLHEGELRALEGLLDWLREGMPSRPAPAEVA